VAADDNGFSDQFRMPLLLNGSKEGIHIDMKNPAGHESAQNRYQSFL